MSVVFLSHLEKQMESSFLVIFGIDEPRQNQDSVWFIYTKNLENQIFSDQCAKLVFSSSVVKKS